MGFLDEFSATPEQPKADQSAAPSFLSQFGGGSGAAPAEPAEKPSGLRTAAIHGLHGITSGFSDEMSGLAAAQGHENYLPLPADIAHGLARLGWQKLTGERSASEAYTKARDARRKELSESAEEHPAIALGSDIAGSLAVPGGSALKGATWGNRLLRGAGVAGIQGGVRGAGEAPELGDVPIDAAKGAAIGAAIGAPVNAVIGPRGTSAAKQALVDAAEQYGVQLPKYMVSENPITQFYGKTFEQLPFVGSKLSGAAEKARSGVQAIRDDLVDNGLGTIGSTPSEARTIASKALTDAREGFVQNSKAVSKANYEAITNSLANPSNRIPLTNLEQAVDDLTAKYAGAGVKASPLIKRAQRAVEKGDLSYDEMKFLRTKLSEKHQELKKAGGVDYAEYSQLREALSNDMENAILKAGGPNSLKMWELSNVYHGASKDAAKQLDVAIGKGVGDTSAADTVFRNISSTRPNIQQINLLRNTMHPDEWGKVQAATVARMGADDAGNFSIQKFITANSKLSDAGKNAMFGFPGSAKRDGYEAILKIGGAIQKLERFRNFSNTANAAGGIAALYELFHDPVGGAKDIAAGGLLGVLLARPATARNAGAFAKAFEKYAANPAAVAAGKVPRALEIAARNLAISAVTQDRAQ